VTESPAAGLLESVRALEQDPHRPRLICHTADGARTELSGASLANWTAKVAGLLRDELGVGPGDVAAVTAGTGWQLAPVLLGCWWAGLAVAGTDGAPPASVAFVDPGNDADADDVFVLSGHPLGAPATDIADHQRDFTTAVLPQSDRLGAAVPHGEGWTAAWDAGDPVAAAALMRRALDAAGRLGTAGERPVVLSTLPWTVPHGAADVLLSTLAVGGALVQCPRDLSAEDLAAIADAEHAGVSVGARVDGVPAGEGG
jgi:uncharacterized protein (TIGR03089 family)